MLKITSVFDVHIRLTSERWSHIVEEHNELAGIGEEVLETISNPECVFQGNYEEFLAVREFKPGKYLVAVYREDEYDGFIITAFLTKRISYLNKRKKIWPK